MGEDLKQEFKEAIETEAQAAISENFEQLWENLNAKGTHRKKPRKLQIEIAVTPHQDGTGFAISVKPQLKLAEQWTQVVDEDLVSELFKKEGQKQS